MYYKKKDVTFYYEQTGTGNDSIIILPGWGNTRPTFQRIIHQFQNNHTIYIFDYPGFGKSPIPNKILTIYDYAEIISSFIQEKQINNPIIIAHSFGGRIVSLLSAKYQVPIKKLILIDIAGIKRRKTIKQFFKEKLYKFLKTLTNLFPKKKRKQLKQLLLNKFSSPDYQSLPPAMRKTFQNIISEDHTHYFKKIQTNTLIIWGEKDQDTPIKDGILLEKIIPNSALIVYRNASHYSYLDYPYETSLIIESFLQEKKES